ncbi:MAG: hypothetical protein ACKOPN_02015 [Prochlorococcaceae cyanobacterium]
MSTALKSSDQASARRTGDGRFSPALQPLLLSPLLLSPSLLSPSQLPATGSVPNPTAATIGWPS